MGKAGKTLKKGSLAPFKVFKSPKVPGKKEAERAQRLQREQLLSQESEIEERRSLRRRFMAGRSSLLTGSETGRDTLG